MGAHFAVDIAEDELDTPGVWPSPRPDIRWVDAVTVSQTGAIAFASRCVLLDDRIAAHQAVMFEEFEGLSAPDLEGLVLLEAAVAGDPR